MKPPADPKDATHQRRILWAVLQRLGLFLGIGVSLLVIWWSVNRLIDAQHQTASLEQQVARLTGDIELMHNTWTEAQIAEVGERFAVAQQNLFDGAEALTTWREAVVEDSVPLALDAAIQFTGTRAESIGTRALTVMQAQLDLTPADGVTAERTSYRRVLDLAHRLTTHPRRLDLVELSVQGGSNSVSRASAVVELWGAEQEERQP